MGQIPFAMGRFTVCQGKWTPKLLQCLSDSWMSPSRSNGKLLVNQGIIIYTALAHDSAATHGRFTLGPFLKGIQQFDWSRVKVCLLGPSHYRPMVQRTTPSQTLHGNTFYEVWHQEFGWWQEVCP
jgi:hypothetical protein